MIIVDNIHTKINDKEILKGVTLNVNKGEVVVLMGPNGSGKSTLANVLLGNEIHEVTQGDIRLEDESILEDEVDERAKKGLFMSFQHPPSIPGVTIKTLLKTALKSKEGSIRPAEFNKRLTQACKQLQLSESFVDRAVNEGFSGGERKKTEILQLLMLNPKFAILDETDSGLDVDALRIVGEGVKAARNKENAFLIITHYPRLLKYIEPDRVYVIKDGKVTQEGTAELAHKIEQEGFIEDKE